MRDETGVSLSWFIFHPHPFVSLFAFLLLADYHYAAFYFNGITEFQN